ncbi:MAG: metallophosphoesterase family protein [Candidatus Bilamarchaeaceae archaeon]
MRVLHIGDLHISSRYMRELTLPAASGLSVLDAILKIAADKQPDVVVCTGDVFDQLEPVNSKPVLTAVNFFRSLQAILPGAPILVVRGTLSHDPYRSLHVLSLAGCLVADEEPIGFDYHAVRFVLLPALPKRAIFGTAPADVIRGTLELHGNGKAIQILCAHGTVAESVNEHGVPMDGSDWEFSLADIAKANVNAVLLGHIHKPQDWRITSIRGEALVSYAGSVGRFTIGEDHNKSVSLITIDRDQVGLERIPVPASESLIAGTDSHTFEDLENFLAEDARRSVRITMGSASDPWPHQLHAKRPSQVKLIKTDNRTSIHHQKIRRISSIEDAFSVFAEIHGQDPTVILPVFRACVRADWRELVESVGLGGLID